MKGKSPATFARRMIRANARRQAQAGLSGQTPTSLPRGLENHATAGLEVRIEPFRPAGGPVIDLKPEEIEIRVDGIAITLESSGRRVRVGQAGLRSSTSESRNTVALLEPVPAGPRTWEIDRDPRAEERRQRVLDLVAGNPETWSAQAAVGLKLLAGRVTGRADAGAWRLRFEPSWPAGPASRRQELYNVMLSPAGQVLVFEERRGTTAEEREGLEVSLEGEGERIWGILAFDPETGKVRMRRLTFTVPRGK